MSVVILYISGRNRDRSPAAEIITNQMAKENGLEVAAVSAGLRSSEYLVMSLEMAVALGSIRYKASPARQSIKMLTAQLLASTKPDLVLCMERSEKEEVLAGFPSLEGKTHTIAAYAGLKDEDIKIRRMHKVRGYGYMELLPYVLRTPIYYAIGAVDPRDETAVAGLYDGAAMKIEKRVQGALRRMYADGMFK